MMMSSTSCRWSRLIWAALGLLFLAIPSHAEPISRAHLYTLDSALCAPKMQGRATGTEGGRQAQQLVAAEFERLQLSMLGTDRMDDVKAKIDNSGYYLPFGLFDHFEETAPSHLGWRTKAPSKRLTWLRDYRADKLSASTIMSAEAVYVGFGFVASDGSHNDYSGKDVTGKIVVVVDGAPDVESLASSQSQLPSKIIQAASRKARAMLFVVDDREELRSTMVGDQVTMSLPVMRVKRSAAKPLIDALNNGESPIVSLAVELRAVNTGASNVAGWLNGTDPKLIDRPLLVTSHADHLGIVGNVLYPGADDNASGTAVMLALASAFKDRPLRRPILFVAFMGEEKGVLGSNAFVRQPAWPLEQIEAVLDLDMIGRLRDDKLSVMCVGSSEKWSGLLDDVNKAAIVPFELSKEDSYSGVSDFAAFMGARVPSLFLFTGLHPDYHKSTDTVDTLNIWGQKRVALFAEQILRKLDSSDEKPVFQVKVK